MPPKRKQSNPPVGRQPARKRQNSGQAESDDGKSKPAASRQPARKRQNSSQAESDDGQPKPPKAKQPARRRQTSSQAESDDGAPPAGRAPRKTQPKKVKPPPTPGVRRGLRSTKEDHSPLQVLEPTTRRRTKKDPTPDEDQSETQATQVERQTTMQTETQVKEKQIEVVDLDSEDEETGRMQVTEVQHQVVQTTTSKSEPTSSQIHTFSTRQVSQDLSIIPEVDVDEVADMADVGIVQTSDTPISGEPAHVIVPDAGCVKTASIPISGEADASIPVSGEANQGFAPDVGGVETPNVLVPDPVTPVADSSRFVTPVQSHVLVGTPDSPEASFQSMDGAGPSHTQEDPFLDVEVDPSYIAESRFTSLAHVLNYRRHEHLSPRANPTFGPPKGVDSKTDDLQEELGPDASTEALLERIAALEARLAEQCSEITKERMLTSCLAAERDQHLYRNKQWEVVGRVNGMSPEKVYALRPQELDELERKVKTVEEEEDAMEDSAEQESPVMQADSAAYELLRKVERASKASKRRQTDVAMTDAASYNDANSFPSQAPSTPNASNEGMAGAPRSTGWIIPETVGRILQRFVPRFLSPLPAAPVLTHPPATAPPAMLDADEAHKLREELKPTTPTRPSRHQKTQNQLSLTGQKLPRRKQVGSSRVVVKRYLKTVDDDLKPKAKEWFKEQLKKIEDDTRADQPGIKRKRPTTPVKIGDLDKIPARAPWQATGSFGLQDEFFDESDDEDAPAWVQIQEILGSDKEESAPKRQKTSATDSTGGSSSMTDVTPRQATNPSPMFGSAEQSYHGGNLFTSAEKEAAEKEMKRAGHISGTGTFCVPEDDSDEDSTLDSSEITPDQSTPEQSTPLWTQQPPPAPTPAHASLPGPVTSTPTVPAVQQEDPAEIQRKRAMKYTPARPSRLRHQELPSPAIDGDAGAAKPGLDHSFQVPQEYMVFDPEMLPDAVEFQLDDPVFAESVRASGPQGAGAFGGGDIDLVSSEDESDGTVSAAERLLSPAELDAGLAA